MKIITIFEALLKNILDSYPKSVRERKIVDER